MKRMKRKGIQGGLAVSLLAVLLALVATIAVGCASEEGVSEDEMRSIVSEAVAESMPEPQEQMSAADIQSMVASSMMEMLSGLGESQITADQVQSMVDRAVMQAAEQGATAQEIEALVRNAVTDVTEGMMSDEEMVSAEEIEAMVRMAVNEATTEAMGGLNISSEVSMAVAENSLTEDEIEAIVAKALEEQAMMEETPKETIIFSDLDWTSVQVQNRVAQFIVEHGYGYPTEVVYGSTIPNFQGFQKGDIHVTMEIWLPNQSLGWSQAVELGEIVSVGVGGLVDWQSYFVIPKYLADQYPDLKTPQDLKKPEYQELFATADSRGKARLVGCVIGWNCEPAGSQQIESYGLVDSLHVINPGSQAAMFADINGAYSKQEPWLGYMWGTGAPGLLLDLVRLEEPPFTEECWAADKACAFGDSTILKAVHKSLLARAPDVIKMLQNWTFDARTYGAVFAWMQQNEGSEPSDGAVWFLNNNDVWDSWVTPDAAARVKAALAEMAEG